MIEGLAHMYVDVNISNICQKVSKDLCVDFVATLVHVSHIANVDFYTGLLFARREDDSILKLELHLSNV